MDSSRLAALRQASIDRSSVPSSPFRPIPRARAKLGQSGKNRQSPIAVPRSLGQAETASNGRNHVRRSLALAVLRRKSSRLRTPVSSDRREAKAKGLF